MAICLSIYNSIDYHFEMDSKSELVPFSEKSSITREDNKIILTFEGALNYLKQALKNPEIYRNYGKYFACAELQSIFETLEANNSLSTEDLERIKTEFVTEMCNRLSEGVKDDLKISTIEKIIELSAKGLALDKKTGTLFLITKNQRNNLYSYIVINATNSENPTLDNWKRQHSNLTLTDRENKGYLSEDLVHNGCKFSIAHNQPSSKPVITVKFIWENKKEEIDLFYNTENLLTEQFQDRKYLHISYKSNELYFKSHENNTTPLLSDQILLTRNLPEFLECKIPTNGCFFIQNEVLKELFRFTPSVKSANSYIDPMQD